MDGLVRLLLRCSAISPLCAAAHRGLAKREGRTVLLSPAESRDAPCVITRERYYRHWYSKMRNKIEGPVKTRSDLKPPLDRRSNFHRSTVRSEENFGTLDFRLSLVLLLFLGMHVAYSRNTRLTLRRAGHARFFLPASFDERRRGGEGIDVHNQDLPCSDSAYIFLAGRSVTCPLSSPSHYLFLAIRPVREGVNQIFFLRRYSIFAGVGGCTLRPRALGHLHAS